MSIHPNIARGIMAVRAEGGSPDIKAVIEDMNAAIIDFKAHHTKEIESLRKDTQRQFDDLAIKEAAAQHNGNGSLPDRVVAALTDTGIRTMRKPEDFVRFYKAHAQANGGHDERVTLADFMKGVAGLPTTNAVKAALSVGTDSAGGYAVPNIVMPAILGALAPASSLLQAGAGFVPLDQGAKTVTTAVIDELPQAQWRNENGNVAEANPVFRGVVATPRSLACVIKVSRELLADAIDMNRALNVAVAQAFAKEVDRVGLRGSGTAPEPRGILNTTGVNIVSQGANGASLAGYEGILGGIQAILENDGPMPTAAIMAPRSLVTLGGLEDTTGQPVRKPDMIATMGFYNTSQIPVNLTQGTATDASEIYLGDFTGMYFLLRENVSIQLLREAYAGTGQIGFLCHARVDVVIPYPKAFAVVTGVRK